MAQPGKAKAKILYLLKILQEETDAEHGLSMSQLIGRLAEYGVSAERKSIYADIKVLRAFDIDVKTYQRNPVEYAIDKHGFTLNELMLLVDAVQSCRAVTDKQAQSLITNIKTLASNAERAKLDRLIHVVGRIGSNSESVLGAVDLIHEAMRNSCKIGFSYASNAERAKLDRLIHVVGRIGSNSESVLGAVDLIHEAMRNSCKIGFSYSKRGPDGKRLVSDEDGKHIVTPLSITYDDGFYYLTAWNEEIEDIREYRLDRMTRLCNLEEEPATKNDRIRKHRNECGNATAFGRFIGNEAMVTLAVAEDKAEIIFDRFGKSTAFSPVENGEAKAHVKVCVSDQFFGWVAGMNKHEDKAEIIFDRFGKSTAFSPVENGEAKAHVKVCVSDQFFGWVAGMNKQVRIVGPSKIVKQYRTYLENLLED